MPAIILGASMINLIIAALFIWLLSLTFLFLHSERRFTTLTTGLSKKDLRSILEDLHHRHQLTQKELIAVSKTLNQIKSDNQLHFQKIGFMRYNPFSDTGGDQSFCLSLLDRHDDGVVISSLHSRDQTRIYAKRIKNAKSPGYTLSKEERAVINQAISS